MALAHEHRVISRTRIPLLEEPIDEVAIRVICAGQRRKADESIGATPFAFLKSNRTARVSHSPTAR